MTSRTTLDWTATILSAAQTGPTSTHPLDGIDLLPVLTGAERPRERTLFWRIGTQGGAVRRGTWKYHCDEGGERLFDLVLDQGERTDRKAQDPERFSQLRSAYQAWSAEMLPPLVRGAGGD